jgi:hypothetical protein
MKKEETSILKEYAAKFLFFRERIEMSPKIYLRGCVIKI